jgi:uncharacterized BrkB/YihY/UPF0761 family membrane protein
VIAVLIWIQLVARWMLFSCAWTATVADEGPRRSADRARRAPKAVAVS